METVVGVVLRQALYQLIREEAWNEMDETLKEVSQNIRVIKKQVRKLLAWES